MKTKKVIIGVASAVVILLILSLGINVLNNSEERIKNLEKTKEVSLSIYSDEVSNAKSIDIIDEEDINELVKIFEDVTLSDKAFVTTEDDYYIPKISFYDSENAKIVELSLYNLGVKTGDKSIYLKDEEVEKVREIINKYAGNNYGKVSCQNNTNTDTYYVYDNNVVKYVKEVKDLTENANFDKLKSKVDESEGVANYSAFLIYDGKEYGVFPKETIRVEEDYYYYSETYLIDKMKEQELDALLNMPKTDFENKTVKDIESKYKDGVCKSSIW